MVADSDGQTLTAVVICEGNISDPDFPDRLNDLVGKLSSLITPEDEEGYDTDSSTSSSSSSDTDDNKRKTENSNKKVKVSKVEPWNSVRVTLSIPKEAATKLRELASAGNNALRALGILSVQLEGDSVISLRLVGREIVLRTDGASNPSTGSSTNSDVGELSKILQSPGPILDPVPGPSKVVPVQQQNGPSTSVFKSPNTVCPMDGKLPVHVSNLPGTDNAAEYPFESMIRARVIHRKEFTQGMNVTTPTTTGTPTGTTPFVQPAPPPPYPTVAASGNSSNKGVVGSPTSSSAGNGSNNIAISSPLLVNLLQNEGAGPSTGVINKPSNVNSGVSGKCTVQANGSSNNKGKSTLVTSQQQLQQQQVAGTQDKQAIVINNNFNKSPNNVNSELTGATNSTSPLMSQSSPVPLPRPQMSSNATLPMQQRAPSVYFARQQQPQQFNKYVGARQQLPPGGQQPPVGTFPNNAGNVRWKQTLEDPGCQEFDRYQKQYNHSQQQQENTQVIGAVGGEGPPPSYGQQHQTQQQQQPTNRSSHPDPLGLGNLADLADLSKNDLDSLLPSLHPHDLDSALFAFDTKGSSLDSLLDIDLISSLDGTTTTAASSSTSSSASGNSKQLTNGPIIENNHTTTPQVQLKQTTKVESQRFLINPLTGDMEITHVEDTSEQDANNVALVGADFHETYKSDDDDDDESSRGTNFSAKFPTSDMSDTEKSNQSGDLQLQKPGVGKKTGRTKKEKIVNADGTVMKVVKEKAQKTRVSKVKKAVITPVPSPTGGANAELKLRLKLDTSNQTPLKKPIASKPMVTQQYNFNASIAQQFMQQSTPTPTTQGNASPNFNVDQQSAEEPRVPPLHISIKNKSVVIKNASTHKKEKKRFLSQSGSESGDDSSLRMKKKNSELLKIMSETSEVKNADTKRLTHEISSPNGMLGPEKKRRLSANPEETVVGSTNIGTIGPYSLVNHLKEKSNLRTLLKTSTPPTAVTQQLTTQVKSPVKNTLIVNSITGTGSKTTLKALLTQGSDSMINEEKFKQKLLENTEDTAEMTFQNEAKTGEGTTTTTTIVQQVTSDNQSNTQSTTTAPNIQRPTLQRQGEVNSPKRETGGGGVLIDPALLQQNVRGSPGSQAQGEDSGIESMDALSEKSPHQNSHSPQGGATENLLITSRAADVSGVNTNTTITPSSGRDTNNSTNNNKVSVSDMHSSTTPDDYYGPNDIEAALANMEGINEFVASYEKETKLNGDHSAIVTSKSNLLADLGEPKEDKYEFHDSPQSQTLLRPSKDLNENKAEVTKDECCTTTQVKQIKNEEKSDIKDDLEPCPVRTTPALYTYSNSDKYRGDMTDAPDIKVEIPSPSDKMLTQLSIEIPQNNENDNSTRIRTRASSKLESPLEIGAKQSPSDSPAANLKATLSKLSTAAIDRLSPKGQVKKRKRAGSESSNQSCVSDDLQTRTKKIKKTENDLTKQPPKTQLTPNVKVVVSKNPTEGVLVKTGRTIKRSECSSDSDEPLIEIAGKVRNSKLSRSASSSTSSLTGDCEKVLRNHRVVNANNVSQASGGKIVPKNVTTPATPATPIAGPGEEKVSTRRSVRMTSSALSTSALKAKVQANPGMLNVTTPNAKTGNGTISVGQKDVAGDGTPEARRKTRSAGLDGAPITAEGRRRRNSRDGK